MAAGERSFGFGIVGCGVIAPAHAEALASLSNARLVAVTDVVADKAKAFALDQGVTWEPDLATLLGRPDIDVVSVCVPSGRHAEVGEQVARAGKHLVVEKPIDVTLSAADRLLSAVREAGVRLTVVSQRRFDPGLVELRALVDQGRLGRLVLGDAKIKWYRSQAYYDSADWRGTWALDGGGALMNQGVHWVDMLRWIMGPVAEVSALCATQCHEIEVEDVALAILRFESGAVGTIEVTTAVFPGLTERLEVSGTGGTVVVEAGRISIRQLVDEAPDVGTHGLAPGAVLDHGPGAAGDPADLGIGAHAAQLADFLAALESGQPPLVTGDEARACLETVLAVYESARRHAPVTLPLPA